VIRNTKTEIQLAKPTPGQLAWQDYEIGMFIHFDMNLFMPPGWWHDQYENKPDAKHFNPAKLDADQWMEAAKAMGAKYAVLTANHGTGFMLWQTDAYPYGVRQAAWRNGQGDVVKEFVDACRRHGIAPGIYSHMLVNGWWQVNHPGIVNNGKGGDSERQTQYAKAKFKATEDLWRNYGPLAELWFDGGIPDPALAGFDVMPLLHKYQPNAMVFQSPAATIRWIGNENGQANATCWATVPSVPEAMGWEKQGRTDLLTTGVADGAAWLPGECDVPLRRLQWFSLPGDEHLIESVDTLMGMYRNTVGRNGNLLLNVGPNSDGLIPEADLQRCREFGAEIQRRYGKSVAETSGRGDVVELKLAQPTEIEHVILMEEIAEGERIRAFVVEGNVGGQWQPLCQAESVGHKRIEHFTPRVVSAVRLRVTKAAAEPLIRRMAVFTR